MEKKHCAHQLLHSITKIAGGLSTVLGLVVLVGWYTNNVTLIQIFPIFVPMQFNTALGFLVCGIGVLSQSFGRNRLAMACGLTAVVIGFLTLLQYIFNVNLGIDQLLMKHYITVKTSHPGRMAPNTALCFGLSGAALLIFSRVRRTRHDLMVVGLLGSITAALGVVSFFGYLSGVETAYGWGNLTRMAVHTAAGFFALGMGIFAFAWFEGMVEDTWIPDWIAFPAGIGMATVALTEWQALNTELSAEHSSLPVFVLIAGFLMTLLLIATIQLAQISWRRAKDVERVNWRLKNEIIERKQMEVALRESEEHLRTVFEAADNVAFVTTDIGGENTRVIGFSPGAEKIFGYTAEEILGQRVAILHPLDVVEDFPVMQQALREGSKGHAGEATLVRKSGERFPSLFTIHSLFDGSGALIGTVGVSIDITELKQAEKELQKYRDHLEELVEDRTNELKEKTDKIKKSRKAFTYLVEDVNETGEELRKVNMEFAVANKELKEFAYIVSHDLKAPLRAISQLTHWISEDYSEAFDDDGKMQMDLILKRVKRMDSLIDGILRYSRVGRIREKEERLDLNLIVKDIIDALSPPDNVKIIIENELPDVLRDSVRMEQVFQNLIGNAIKFMDKGEGIIKVGCADEGAFWKFSVSDNGPGIDKRYHDKIFQIFQTLMPRDEHESTGIGLTLVKKIIKLYGGSVWVESEAGHGAIFFFTLPKKGEKYEKL